MQLNDEGHSDTVAKLKGDVTIYYEPIFCTSNSTHICSSTILVVYQRTGVTLAIDVDQYFNIRVNHELQSNMDLQPFVNDFIYIKKTTTLFVSISGFGFNVLFNPHGQVYVTLDPFFMSKVGGRSMVGARY